MPGGNKGRAEVLSCGEVRGRLYPFLLRTLEPAARDEVEAHTSRCDACRLVLAAARGRLGRIGGAAAAESDGRPRLVPLRRILVIGGLAVALVALALGWSARRSAARAARAEQEQFLARLERALFLYRDDFGRFPPADGAPLAVYLGTGQAHGPYLELAGERVSAAGRLLDAWNRPWIYRLPGRHNPRLFDLQSLGPNGRDEDGAGDDLANFGR